MKPRRFLLAGAFALATTMLPAFAEPPNDRNVFLNGASVLVLDVRAGDLTAVPDPLLKIVQIHSHSSGAASAGPKFTIARRGKELLVTIDGPGPAVLPFAGGSGHVYEVHYPPALALRVRQFGGAVEVVRPQAPVEIYDESGAITVTEPRASVAALADSGNVNVSAAHGPVELTAGDGNVEAQLATGWSGRLVKLEASSGNLHLAVPQNFRARYDTTAGTGTVTNPLRSESRAPLVFMLTQRGNVTVSVENP